MTYKKKTAVELEQLAQDAISGRVFGTWDVPEHSNNMIPSIFMVLALADKKFFDALKEESIIHAYEFIDKAGPLAVNGFPTFMSCHLLDKDDSAELFRRMDENRAAQRARMEAAKQ